MAPRDKLALPSASALASSTRLSPGDPSVARVLTRLSRPALLSLAQEWLKPQNQSTCAPYLRSNGYEDDSLNAASRTLDEIRELYSELDNRKGGKRDVLDQILEGDWRHGLSLQQLAMADVRHLLDHPKSCRWSALHLVSISPGSKDEGRNESLFFSKQRALPIFHAPTFLKNMQQEIGPLVKAHYYLTRMPSLPLTLLRVGIYDLLYYEPNSVANALVTTIYIAFPENTLSVYVSFASTARQSGSVDGRGIRKLVIDALPKALSRPGERYSVGSTCLAAKSLAALVGMKGPGPSNAAAGGWSILAAGTAEESPLTASAPISDLLCFNDDNKENHPIPGRAIAPRTVGNRVHESSRAAAEDEPLRKRRRRVAEIRFGEIGIADVGKGIERFEVRLEDPFSDAVPDEQAQLNPSSSDEPASRKGRRSVLSLFAEAEEPVQDMEEQTASVIWAPHVQMTFSGTDIFAGVRKLVESGAVDGEKMPGWMTGENTVSIGVVRNGRLRGDKGTGVH